MIWQRHPRARSSVLPLLLACALPLPAHPQASSADTVYRLHGRVLNGVSNQPLARALVTSGDRRLAVMTGNEGQFSIDISVSAEAAAPPRSFGLSNNFLNLTAQKPGYIAPQTPEVLPLDATLPSRDVVLKLMPAAAISGHVSSITRDAVPNLRITLLAHLVEDGDLTWRQAGSQATNSRGEFHFTNLRPGEYTVMSAQYRGDQLPVPRPQPEAVTQQYPAVFFGDAPTLDAATRLHLTFGDTVEATLHLHPTSFYPVTIPLAAASAGAVNARFGSGQIFTGYRLAYNPRSGTVEGSLPSGNYDVTLTGPGTPPTSAVLPIHVAGAPLQTAAIALSPPTTIDVQVHEEFTQPENPQNSSRVQLSQFPQSGVIGQTPQNFPLVQITLRSVADGNQITSASPVKSARNDQFTLQNVPPGRYNVRAIPMRGYVAGLSVAGIDLTANSLVVTAGGSGGPLEVTLRDDTAALTGTVNPGSAPAPQSAFILLLPTDTKGRFTQTFAGPNGKFAVALPPGSYRVLAVKGIFPQLPYRDPEAMHRYDGKGVTVIVTAGQSLQIDVPLLETTDLEVP